MGQVASGWGQPFSVEGLVNTGGTQDSLAVSPDAQYLFLQYYPVSLSCFLQSPLSASHPYCQIPVGPVAAPQRPNMPGASRVNYSNNSVHHGCPSLGYVAPDAYPVPPLAQYGFRRQADGSYAEPFVFMFTGGDGCFAPWGPSVRANGDGTYRMFVAFNDPRNSGTASDFAHVYDFNFSPDQTQTLGNVSLNGSGAIQINNFVLNQATITGADVHRGKAFRRAECRQVAHGARLGRSRRTPWSSRALDVGEETNREHHAYQSRSQAFPAGEGFYAPKRMGTLGPACI